MHGAARPPFGAALRRLRLDAGFTQEALAERTGLSVRGIQNLEAGERHPYPDTLARLIRAFGLDGDDRARFEDAGRPIPRHRPLGHGDPGDVAPRHSFPLSLASFIGRDREVAAVRELLRSNRLVTLTGPGGIGKTRLALQAAAEAREDFSDGVWFVSLASIVDPGLVLSTVAQCLGIREVGNRPVREQLRGRLRDQHLLLLLDNFEQVLAAAPDVGALLAESTTLTVLVTSRAPLHLVGEQEYSAPPMTIPDSQQPPSPRRAIRYEAVALFVARARAVRPDFSLTGDNAAVVAEICRRLDGLPLAIELAAVWTKLLPPPALRDRLGSRMRLLTGGPRDAPARQRTLRTTIDWSYNLLTPTEQGLFRWLRVFVGGCTLEAAEAVCHMHSGGALDVLEGIAALVDASLVRQDEAGGDEPRLTMLETIREYALERLAECAEADRVRRIHAAYYLALAERAEPEMEGPGQTAWYAHLDREQDNLRTALQWAQDQHATDLFLRLTGALGKFWDRGGRLTEGRDWLERALAAGGGSALPRAKALARAAALTGQQRDDMRAAALAEESLALYRQLGDWAGQADTLTTLGLIAVLQGDYAAARPYLEQGLAAAQVGGAWSSAARALGMLSMLTRRQGDYPAARSFEQERLVLVRELGDTVGIVDALTRLFFIAIACDQDAAAAESLADEVMRAAREAGDRSSITDAIFVAGIVAALRGDYELARQRLSECLALHKERGDRGMEAQVLHDIGWVACRQGDVAAAGAHFAQSLAMWRAMGDVPGVLQALDGAAGIAVAQGQPDRAARLLGASAALSAAIGHRWRHPIAADDDRDVAAAKAALGESGFVAAWAAGEALTLEQAVAEALDDSA